MNKYVTILDKILTDLLTDLSSLRVWLIFFGFIFNIYVLWLVAFYNVHYSVSIASVALLTAIYTFFFASKNKQAEIENGISVISQDPPTTKDPDGVEP